MTKALKTKILSAIKKLKPWIWYPVTPKEFTRDELIEVLKSCIDDGMPYQIRGDWQQFRLETKEIGKFSWQKQDPLPEGVTIEHIKSTDDTSFTLPNGRKYEYTGPAHVIIRCGDKIIGIETPLKQKNGNT